MNDRCALCGHHKDVHSVAGCMVQSRGNKPDVFCACAQYEKRAGVDMEVQK